MSKQLLTLQPLTPAFEAQTSLPSVCLCLSSQEQLLRETSPLTSLIPARQLFLLHQQVSTLCHSALVRSARCHA